VHWTWRLPESRPQRVSSMDLFQIQFGFLLAAHAFSGSVGANRACGTPVTDRILLSVLVHEHGFRRGRTARRQTNAGVLNSPSSSNSAPASRASPSTAIVCGSPSTATAGSRPLDRGRVPLARDQFPRNVAAWLCPKHKHPAATTNQHLQLIRFIVAVVRREKPISRLPPPGSRHHRNPPVAAVVGSSGASRCLSA